MEDPALPDPFAEERTEYARTIEDLFDKLAESEQDRATAVEGWLDAEERRRLAEEDLRAQIEKAKWFEGLYYAEWEKRKAIEEELARCSKEESEAAKKPPDEDYSKLKEEEE